MNTDGLYADLQPGTHLLLDENVIADMYKLRRSIHSPRKDPCEPVMSPDQPWEDQRIEPAYICYDSDTERWRMWYRVHHAGIAAERKKLGNSVNGNVGSPQPLYTCYCESDDGVHWDKRPLGIVDNMDGQTNIVFKGFSEASGGILDLPGKEGHGRFVFFNCEWFENAYGRGGITLAHSEDGLNWKYLHPDPLIHGDSDTFNNAIYDARRDRYVVYMRGWHASVVDRNADWIAGPGYAPGHQRNTRRRVGCAISEDLLNWSEPQIVHFPDELQTNDIYGLHVFEAGGYFLGQALVYDDDAFETIHVELVYSRDGIRWQHFPDRQPFIATSERDQPEGYMVYPAQTPTTHGDQVVHYWAGLDQPHDLIESRSTIYRGVLRKDGYVSLDASRQLAGLILRPFTLQNDQITINAATQGGRIDFELVEPWAFEAQGKVIDGFTFDDCDSFTGNSTEHVLSWKGRSDLSQLMGRRLMLRMRMYHSQIYSVTL